MKRCRENGTEEYIKTYKGREMEKRTYHYQNEDDEIVIDFWELFYELKRRLWLILAAFVIGGAAAGAYSYFLVTPQYTSGAKLYVLSKETTLTSLADLQIGSQLTQDYKELIGSRPVMQQVVDHLNLEIGYRELARRLTVENPKDTRILNLSVTDSDPYMAKAIVDAVAEASSDYIGEIMEMTPPKLIEDGEVNLIKTSPNTKRTALIGGLLGALLICGMVTVTVVLNDTVKTEEDVEKYLELPVLAVIPEKKGGSGSAASKPAPFKSLNRKKRNPSKRKSSRKKAERPKNHTAEEGKSHE